MCVCIYARTASICSVYMQANSLRCLFLSLSPSLYLHIPIHTDVHTYRQSDRQTERHINPHPSVHACVHGMCTSYTTSSLSTCVYMCMYTYIYIYMLPPPSVIYLFRGLPGHAGEHVPKTRGHVHFLMRTHVDRIWQCAVRIVFILAVRNIVHVMKRSYP